MSSQATALVDLVTGRTVSAVLHDDLDELRLIDGEIEWSPIRLRSLRQMIASGQATLPQHIHWNWAVKAVQNRLLAYRTLGIEAAGTMQGLMMVILTGHLARLEPDRNKPVVYVEFLETAPWNSREFTEMPTFKGVGTRLIEAAVRLSYDEGYSGRVGLHSLPQASRFYVEGCGMTNLGSDPDYHDLPYLESPASRSKR